MNSIGGGLDSVFRNIAIVTNRNAKCNFVRDCQKIQGMRETRNRVIEDLAFWAKANVKHFDISASRNGGFNNVDGFVKVQVTRV